MNKQRYPFGRESESINVAGRNALDQTEWLPLTKRNAAALSRECEPLSVGRISYGIDLFLLTARPLPAKRCRGGEIPKRKLTSQIANGQFVSILRPGRTQQRVSRIANYRALLSTPLIAAWFRK